MATSIDYRNFSPDGPVKTFADNQQRRWWTLEPDAAADSVAATITFLLDHQNSRFTQAVVSARLYGNLSLAGISGSTKAKVAGVQNAVRERVTWNVVQSCIDTATSQIGENKPKPYFLTSGGAYKMQRKAKLLNQFVEGLFYECQAYDLGGEAQRDCEVWGDGLIHVFERHGRIAMERVLPMELFVDEVEAQYGHPRSMTRVKPVDRDELAGYFPESNDVILLANRIADSKDGNGPNISDMIQVRESWHLPSSPEAKDGKHLISIDGHSLLHEDYRHDFFPFARWQWCPRPYGYWSQGLAEQLQGIQLEINKLLYLVQRSYHLGGSFKILLQNGSKIVKEHLNNEVGAIINYAGAPPQYITPPLVPMEIYQHLQTLKNSAYDIAGITMMSATGKKPEGLNSGKAIREYRDQADTRHKTAMRYNERGYLELARIAIAVAKDIAKENRGHYKVNAPSHAFLASVDWADINLEEDAYSMQCFPVSSLPSDPAGRLETVQEYMQAGILNQRQGRKLLDFPDLERVESLANAAEEVIAKTLDGICDDGEYEPPDATDDLHLAKEMVLEYINRGKLQNLDEDRLEMLRTYSSQIDMMLEMAVQSASSTAAPMPGQASGTGAPLANPTPTPTSDLLPNAPGAGATLQ